MQIQVGELRQISQCQWNGPSQLIIRQIQGIELCQFSQCRWNGNDNPKKASCVRRSSVDGMVPFN